MASRPDAVKTAAPKPTIQGRGGFSPGLAMIAVCQVGWLVWILGEPLPNAGNVGGSISRGSLLWRFLPEVVPGVTWNQTFLAAAVNELSHVENLPQRLPIVLASGFILGSAIGLGRLILRGIGLRGALTRAESIALAFGLGMTGLAWITLMVGRFGLISPWTIRLGLCAPILAEAWASWKRGRPWDDPARSPLTKTFDRLAPRRGRPLSSRSWPWGRCCRRSISTRSNITSKARRNTTWRAGSRSCRIMSTQACLSRWRCFISSAWRSGATGGGAGSRGSCSWRASPRWRA